MKNLMIAAILAVSTSAAMADTCKMDQAKVVGKKYQSPGTSAPSGVEYTLTMNSGIELSIVELQSEVRAEINSMLDLALSKGLRVNLVVNKSGYSTKACDAVAAGSFDASNGSLYFPTSDVSSIKIGK